MNRTNIKWNKFEYMYACLSVWHVHNKTETNKFAWQRVLCLLIKVFTRRIHDWWQGEELGECLDGSFWKSIDRRSLRRCGASDPGDPADPSDPSYDPSFRVLDFSALSRRLRSGTDFHASRFSDCRQRKNSDWCRIKLVAHTKNFHKLKKKKGDTATKTRAHTEIHQRMMSEGKIK